MKRSEMIEIIEAELYCIQAPRKNSQGFLKSIANSILDRIEEEGMLPSNNFKKVYIKRDFVPDLMRVMNCHTWEPEDG